MTLSMNTSLRSVQQCDRVTALVRQLLAFARKQILDPRNISLNQTVKDVVNLLENVIGKDIELKTTLQEPCRSSHADPTPDRASADEPLRPRFSRRHAGRQGVLRIGKPKNVEFKKEQCRKQLRAAAGALC